MHKQKLIYLIILIISFILSIILIYKIKQTDLFNISNNSNGLNRCDGIIYINLENRTDRKQLFLKEINKLDIDKSKIHKVSGIYVPKNGHKGCIQSHILALRIAKMNNWNMTCIMEDDMELIKPPNEFNKDVNNIFDELNKKNINWDVIMLSVLYKNIDTKQKYETIDRILSGTTGTCYIVKKEYIDKLLSLFEHCQTMMKYNKWGDNDNHEPYALDQKWSELMKKDNWFAPKDNLIKQRNIRSTTNNRL